ncbi:MAG: YggU family protein [Euryarchaeota archaeon]|nr:YggU family protein [Euryarchaeota archaeon]
MTMPDPDWHKAIRAAADGCLVDLEVQPGADRDEVPSGYNEWRGRIQARVQARPQAGEANEALLAAFASTLGIPRSRLSIADGATSRRKRVHVQGLPVDELHRILEEVLGGG